MNNILKYNIGDNVLLFHNKFCCLPFEECNGIDLFGWKDDSILESFNSGNNTHTIVTR